MNQSPKGYETSHDIIIILTQNPAKTDTRVSCVLTWNLCSRPILNQHLKVWYARGKQVGIDTAAKMKYMIALSLLWYTQSFPCISFHRTSLVAFHHNSSPSSYQRRADPTKAFSSATCIEANNSEIIEYTEGQEYAFLSSLDESVYGAAFLQRLHELQDFKAIHGHCRVPKRYALNKKLG